MDALRTIGQEIVVEIEYLPEYQIHRFFYKALYVGRVLWRPAVYHSPFHCDRCPKSQGVVTDGHCFVCKANLHTSLLICCSHGYLNLKIGAYITTLFQLFETEIELHDSADGVSVDIRGTIMFTFNKHLEWTNNVGRCKDQEVKIFNDRLELYDLDQPEDIPTIFHNKHPFHKNILHQLRNREPFSSAPVWLK